ASAAALLAASASAQAPPAFPDVAAELARQAAARGATLSIVDCQQNLRERACVGEIVQGSTRDVLAATKPIESRDSTGGPGSLGSPGSPGGTVRSALVGLDLRPLVARMTPMLDVAVSGDRLLVLGPDAVTLLPLATGGPAESAVSKPIVTLRQLPRDL